MPTIAAGRSDIISDVTMWSVELEPEVKRWLESLPPDAFATVAFHIDRLAQLGSRLRMPHSRSLGDGLFELRFDLAKVAQRLAFFFPGNGRIVLLTVFRKQRSNERAEVERARRAKARCIEEGHGLDEEE